MHCSVLSRRVCGRASAHPTGATRSAMPFRSVTTLRQSLLRTVAHGQAPTYRVPELNQFDIDRLRVRPVHASPPTLKHATEIRPDARSYRILGRHPRSPTTGVPYAARRAQSRVSL